MSQYIYKNLKFEHGVFTSNGKSGLLCWRGWWDGVNPVPSHCPKNSLLIIFGSPSQGLGSDATAKAGWERGHVKAHQWFFPPPPPFFPPLVCFPLWYLNLFLIFFNGKVLFIYLMCTAKLGEKGVVTWDYFFFFFICGMLTVLYIRLE